tara:strand:+ start:230 stop:697 length:468 start_codon:yes stop_codon:yes gene_type:complete
MKKLHQTFWDNGNLKEEGYLKNGVRNGPWKHFNEDGSLQSDSYYQNDLKELDCKEYIRLGGINYTYQGEMIRGTKSGKWVLFINETNKILQQELWWNDMLIRKKVNPDAKLEYDIYIDNLEKDTFSIFNKKREEEKINFWLFVIFFLFVIFYFFT